MSELVGGISPITHRTYDSVRHEFDPATGEAQIFVEKSVSEDDFLKMRGISHEQTMARELQYERVMRHQLSSDIASLSQELESERETHRQEIAELNTKIDELTELVRRVNPSAVGTVEPAPDTAETGAITESTPAAVSEAGTETATVSTTEATSIETDDTQSTTVAEQRTTNERRRQRGRVVLGIAALALAGLIGYEIGHSNDKFQPNTTNKITKSDSGVINAKIDALGTKLSKQIKTKGDMLGGKIGHLESLEKAEHSQQGKEYSTNTGDFSGAHVDFYDQQNPNSKRLTGVVLSKKLHLTGKAGAERLVDSSGKVIVNRVLWTENGVIVPDLVKKLRGSGYDVSYGQFVTKHRFASVVSTK